MQEIWKDIKGYEGLYQVSNLGRVKSLKFLSNVHKKYYDREKILKTGKDIRGYDVVILCRNGVQKGFKVHRLVAEAFIPNPNDLPQVNHIDENKENNCVSNLEFCTNKYNSGYGTRNERISKTMTNNSKISKKVNQYDKQGNFIKEWVSLQEAGRQTKINVRNICSCCKGKYKTAGGYIWKYKEQI